MASHSLPSFSDGFFSSDGLPQERSSKPVEIFHSGSSSLKPSLEISGMLRLPGWLRDAPLKETLSVVPGSSGSGFLWISVSILMQSVIFPSQCVNIVWLRCLLVPDSTLLCPFRYELMGFLTHLLAFFQRKQVISGKSSCKDGPPFSSLPWKRERDSKRKTERETEWERGKAKISGVPVSAPAHFPCRVTFPSHRLSDREKTSTPPNPHSHTTSYTVQAKPRTN